MAADTLRMAGAAFALLTLAACATLPASPSLPALPGSRMSTERFAADDARCRDWVHARLAGLLIGAAAGSAAQQGAWAGAQQQFDSDYYACMYTLGHKAPVPAGEVARYRAWLESAAPGAPPGP
jgi:hypothetical protein